MNFYYPLPIVNIFYQKSSKKYQKNINYYQRLAIIDN